MYVQVRVALRTHLHLQLLRFNDALIGSRAVRHVIRPEWHSVADFCMHARMQPDVTTNAKLTG